MLTHHDATRLAGSLIASELAASRPGGFDRLQRLSWTPETCLGREGIGIDSLELIGVATAVSDFFCLHETGLEDRLLVERTLGAWGALVTEGGARGAQHMAFRTSGSIGAPKRVAHRRDALASEAKWFARLVAGAHRVVATVPAHHIFGFIHTVLLPGELGVPVSDAEFSLRTSLVRALKPGDVVVATPHVWDEIASSGLGFPFAVRGISAGAPMPDRTWDALDALGITSLIDIYGSTESGALGIRARPDEAFTAIDAERVRLQRNDRVAWETNRVFRLLGRADRIAQVGGVNVSLEDVERVLTEHADVADAAARVEGDGSRARVVAFVVPKPGAGRSETFRADLERHISGRLPAVARPASITMGDRVPLGPLGKPRRWDIHKNAA